MKSLLFKVEHGLVSLADLVHEQDLMVNLLEWFNQDNGLCGDVLGLLYRFAQHPASRQTLVEIGGVEFLNHLRNDPTQGGSEPWGPAITPVLDALLALDPAGSTVPPPPYAETPALVDGGQPVELEAAAVVTSSEGYGGDSRRSSGDLSAAPSRGPSSMHAVTPYIVPDFIRDTIAAGSLPPSRSSSIGQRSSARARVAAAAARNQGSSTSPATVAHAGAGIDLTVGSAMAILQQMPCPGILDFATVVLTESDERLLLATSLKLASTTDAATVLATCNFFRNTLLADFPPESFLQHPATLLNLARLLGVTQIDPSGSELMLAKAARECLSALVSALHRRADELDDQFSAERLLEVNPGRATRQKKTTAVNALYLCHALFVQSKAALVDSSRFPTSIMLLQAVLPLLARCVAATPQDSTAPARQKEGVVRECLSVLAEALQHWLPRCNKNRAVVTLINFTMATLDACVPPDSAAQRIPASLCSILYHLATDAFLCAGLGRLRASLQRFLPLLEFSGMAGFTNLDMVREALKSAKRFSDGASELLDTSLPPESGLLSPTRSRKACALLAGAVNAFDTLHITHDTAFVQNIVAVCILVQNDLTSSAASIKQARAHVLKSLVFPVARLRLVAYLQIETHLNSTDAKASRAASVRSILNCTDAMYHLVAFGFADAEERVASSAKRIFMTLTALDDDDRAPEAIEHCIPALAPILQCFFTDAIVGKRMKVLVSNVFMGEQMTSAQTFTCSLRALLHSDKNVRQWGRDKLLRHVFLAPCHRFDADILSCSKSALSDQQQLAQAAKGWGTHSEADAFRLLAVFENITMSLHLRLAAAEQLCLLLHHEKHHAAVLHRGILPRIRSVLAEVNRETATVPEDAIDGAQSSNDSVPPDHMRVAFVRVCITILRLLAQHDAALRANLLDLHGDALLLVCVKYLVTSKHPDLQLRGAVAILVACCTLDERVLRAAPLGRDVADAVCRASEDVSEDSFESPDFGMSMLPGQPILNLPAYAAEVLALPVAVRRGTFRTKMISRPPEVDPIFERTVAQIWFLIQIDWPNTQSGQVAELADDFVERYEEMQLPVGCVEVLEILDDGAQLSAALDRMHHALNHDTVTEVLSSFEAICNYSDAGFSHFVHLPWRLPFNRFLSVSPTSEMDAVLQTRLLKFCSSIAGSSEVTSEDLVWLMEVTSSKLLHQLISDDDRRNWSSSTVMFELKQAIMSLTETLFCNPRNVAMSEITATKCAELLWPVLSIELEPETEDPVDSLRVLPAMLDWLRLLCHMTGHAGFSGVGISSAQLLQCAQNLTLIVNRIVSDVERAGGTYLGTAVTRMAILCSRQIADIIVYRSAAGFHIDTNDATWKYCDSLEWLGVLSLHFKTLVRAESLRLISALAQLAPYRTIVRKMQISVRGATLPLTEGLLAVLFDLEECFAVRSAAVGVLVTLSGVHAEQSLVSTEDQSDQIDTLPNVYSEISQCDFLSKIEWVLVDASRCSELLEFTGALLFNLLLAERRAVLEEMTRAGAWKILAAMIISGFEPHSAGGNVAISQWRVKSQLIELVALAVAGDACEEERALFGIGALILEADDFVVTLLRAIAGQHGDCEGQFVHASFRLLTKLISSSAEVSRAVVQEVAAHWALVLVPFNWCFGDAIECVPEGQSQSCASFMVHVLEAASYLSEVDLGKSLDTAEQDTAPSFSSESKSYVLDITGPVLAISPATQTYGETLCKPLLRLFGTLVGTDFSTAAHALDILGALLAVSHSAKQYALSNGFMSFIAKDIGELHATMCMEGLEFVNSTNSDPLLRRLTTDLRLLANILHRSQQTKTAAMQAGLIAVLEPIWSLCELNDRTLRLLLEVLCNYVAGGSGECARSLVAPFSMRRSLMTAVAVLGCKLIITGARVVLRKVVFGLLTSLVVHTECRNVLWKEGFVDECITRMPVSRKLQPHVFGFLAVASLYKDVQNSLLRTPKQLNAAVEAIAAAAETTSINAVRILRNLCFARSAFTMITKHRTCLTILLSLSKDSNESASEKRTLAKEALTAMLHRCNKTERAVLWPRLAPVLELSTV